MRLIVWLVSSFVVSVVTGVGFLFLSDVDMFELWANNRRSRWKRSRVTHNENPRRPHREQYQEGKTEKIFHFAIRSRICVQLEQTVWSWPSWDDEDIMEELQLTFESNNRPRPRDKLVEVLVDSRTRKDQSIKGKKKEGYGASKGTYGGNKGNYGGYGEGHKEHQENYHVVQPQPAYYISDQHKKQKDNSIVLKVFLIGILFPLGLAVGLATLGSILNVIIQIILTSTTTFGENNGTTGSTSIINTNTNTDTNTNTNNNSNVNTNNNSVLVIVNNTNAVLLSNAVNLTNALGFNLSSTLDVNSLIILILRLLGVTNTTGIITNATPVITNSTGLLNLINSLFG